MLLEKPLLHSFDAVGHEPRGAVAAAREVGEKQVVAPGAESSSGEAVRSHVASETLWPCPRHFSTARLCRVFDDASPSHEMIQMFWSASGPISSGFHLPATSSAPAKRSGSLSIITIDDMQPIDCPVA